MYCPATQRPIHLYVHVHLYIEHINNSRETHEERTSVFGMLQEGAPPSTGRGVLNVAPSMRQEFPEMNTHLLMHEEDVGSAGLAPFDDRYTQWSVDRAKLLCRLPSAASAADLRVASEAGATRADRAILVHVAFALLRGLRPEAAFL